MAKDIALLLELKLRTRIAAGLVGLSIATSIAFGIGAYWAADIMEVLVLEQNIGERARHAAAAIASGEPAQLPSEDWYYGRLQSEADVARDFGHLQSGSHHDVIVKGSEFHVWVEPLPDDRLFLFYDLAKIEVYEGQLKVFLYSLGAVINILAFVIGYFLTPWVAKPVSDLASRVEQLPRDAHGFEIKGKEDRDLTVLANAIDTYLQENNELVERERSFTGMASHEMRTPVAIISAALDVISLNPTSKDIAEPLERVRRATNRMAVLIDVLLDLARNQSPDQSAHAPWQPATMVRDIAAEQLARHPVDEHSIELNLDETVMLTSPAAMFQVVASNLIDNALTHSTGVRILIELNALMFAVQSEGETEATPAHRRLGLSIVDVICSRVGWRFGYATEHEVTTVSVQFDAKA